MLNHVLVPLDGSELSEQALTYAQDVIAPDGKITLVSVIEIPIDYNYSLVDIPLTVVTARNYNETEYNTAHQRVRDYLNAKAQALTKKGFTVECLVESGDPANVIADIASNQKANAIVITTHGRTGFSKWLFGSVTQKIISLMPCPVMVVPGVVPEKSEKAAKRASATA